MNLESRKQIFVSKAFELVKIYGIEYLTIRRLATKAKVTHPVIYKVFPDKEALLDEICKKAFQELHENLEFIKSNSDNPIFVMKNEMYEYLKKHTYLFDYLFKFEGFESLLSKNKIIKLFEDCYKEQSFSLNNYNSVLDVAEVVGQLILKRELKKFSIEVFVEKKFDFR
jgi:AcrR family transcriptional regulator